MECERSEHGRRSGLPQWRGAGDEGGRAAAPPAAAATTATAATRVNDMDEITYWVYTKRAPCLLNFDNVIKKQKEAQAPDGGNVPEAPSPRKRKRKMSLLDDDRVSVTKQKNLYFEASQNERRTAPGSRKSDTLESDIDFNIKNSSVRCKTKKVKGQKNGRTLHKKNKIVTSTPLRRSQRRAQNCVNNNEQLNISCETFACSVINNRSNVDVCAKQQSKKSPTKTPAVKPLHIKRGAVLPDKTKNVTVNGQFEDLSDVSGFTANYIRSTKIHSNSKPCRNLRSKSSRNLVRESLKTTQQENNTTMLVCVNKSVNATTEVPQTSVLNCSTDSSQNVLNLITTKANDKSTKVNRSTSLLKFVDAKSPKVKDGKCFSKLDSNKLTSKTDLDISFQSKSPRYPRRHKDHSTVDITKSNSSNIVRKASPNKRKTQTKNIVETSNSFLKENPLESSLSRTRSGRNLCLTTRQAENTLLVFSNSTEKMSSLNTMNVASQAGDTSRSKLRAKRSSSHRYAKKSMDKGAVSLLKDSLREKSGFTACFSDSDDDSDALKQRKFFC